ncbi:MAG: hypothetical protein KAT71_04440 [Gammaproteobacteria bacterium]|nr:hypothetical protein [Gammaproteobacteria bacterium]
MMSSKEIIVYISLGGDTSASLKTALSVITDFRISKIKANEIIKDVTVAVAQWKNVAQKFGLTKLEIDRMSSGFLQRDK